MPEERVGGAERREGRGLRVTAGHAVVGGAEQHPSLGPGFPVACSAVADLFAILRISALASRAPTL